MVVITTVSDNENVFLYNGKEVAKNYEVQATGVDQSIEIVATGKNETLQKAVKYDQYEVDGTVPSSVQDAVKKLNRLVFKKGGDSETNGAVSVCKTYVQTFKTNKSFGNGNATLLNLFPEVTIQAGKQVRLDIYVPSRNDTTSWGGLYVNINAKVNGTWYNLGNTGYDGGVMQSSATAIHALNHQMILDFIGNLGLDENQEYTLQFELTARTYNGTTYVNQSHDINRTANNLGSRGALQAWASDQNFTHLIITEIER